MRNWCSLSSFLASRSPIQTSRAVGLVTAGLLARAACARRANAARDVIPPAELDRKPPALAPRRPWTTSPCPCPASLAGCAATSTMWQATVISNPQMARIVETTTLPPTASGGQAGAAVAALAAAGCHRRISDNSSHPSSPPPSVCELIHKHSCALSCKPLQGTGGHSWHASQVSGSAHQRQQVSRSHRIHQLGVRGTVTV